MQKAQGWTWRHGGGTSHTTYCVSVNKSAAHPVPQFSPLHHGNNAYPREADAHSGPGTQPTLVPLKHTSLPVPWEGIVFADSDSAGPGGA